MYISHNLRKKFFTGAVCWMLVTMCNATAPDPFSKIIITSTQATCTKSKAVAGTFIFTYKDNVCVTFADQTTVTADELEVVIDSKVAKTSPGQCKDAALHNFKRILFKNNVCVTSAYRKVTSRTARLYLPQQRCFFDGDVKILQSKKTENDVPVTINSEKADLHLKTGQLRLHGNTQVPVSTTIVLEGHPSLRYKKKLHHDQQDLRTTTT